MNFDLFATLMMIYIRFNYPQWPYENIGEAELRSVGAIFREVDPVSDEKFDATMQQLLLAGHQRKTSLLERLATAWARSQVREWPDQRPGEASLRQAISILRRATMATDAQVEDIVKRILHGEIDGGRLL